MPYRITTSRDSSLFFEVPDPDSDAAPRRVAAGTTIPAFDTATNQPIDPLVVGNAGYIDQVVDVPRVDVDSDGGRTTIYSAEWIDTRGEGSAPVHWSWLNLPTDTALLLPDDLLLTDKGQGARWDGNGWVTVTISGGGTGGTPIDPTPVDPDPDPDPDPGTPAPPTGPFPLPFSTSFDNAGGWIDNKWKTTRTAITGGALTITGDATGHYVIKPVTPGATIEAVATVASVSGDARLFIMSYNGDSEGTGTYLAEASTGLTAGTVKTTAQVAVGADRVLIGITGAGNAVAKITDVSAAVTIAAPTNPTPVDPTPTDPTPVDPTPVPVNPNPTGWPSTLVAGASAFDPGHYRAIWGKSAFCTPAKGWPAHNAGDPYSAGRRVRELMTWWNNGGDNSGINLDRFNIPMRVVDTRKPPGSVANGGGGYVIRNVRKHYTWDGQKWDADRWGNKYDDFMANIPFPVDFVRGPGTDKSAEWYDIGTDRIFGGWGWEFLDGEWKFATAGRTDNVTKNTSGAHDKGSIVASCLQGAPMHLGIKEAQEFYRTGRQIDHALGIELPQCDGPWNDQSWPAKAQDSNNSNPWGLRQGARLLLDPTFNVGASNLSTWEKMLAYNLQTYGWIITDTSGATMLRGEYWYGPGTSPWASLATNWGKFGAIPFERVYVTRKDFGKP